MATKPSDLLEWCNTNPTDATSGQTAIINPSVGKKDTGFLRLEKPTRQDFNWFMNTAGLWQEYTTMKTDSISFVGAVTSGVSTSNTGPQNTAGLSVAFAESPHVYLEPGTYAFEGNLNFPDGAILSGISRETILNFTAASNWNGIDKQVIIRNVEFTEDTPNFLKLDFSHTTFEGMTLIEFCFFSSLNSTPFYFNSGTGSKGLFTMRNCTFTNDSKVMVIPGGLAPNIDIYDCVFDNSVDITLNLVNSFSKIRFHDNTFSSSFTYNQTGGAGVVIDRNLLVAFHNYNFTNVKMCQIKDNIYANSSSLIESYTNSRVIWENNRFTNGTLADETETINGVKYYGENTGTNINDGDKTTINFNTNRTVSMARNPNYTMDTIENGAGVFTYLGIGSRKTTISCMIVYTDAFALDFLAVLVVNGVNRRFFSKSPTWGASATIFSLDTTIDLEKGDTFFVEVENNSGNFVINAASVNSVKTSITVEGF